MDTSNAPGSRPTALQTLVLALTLTLTLVSCDTRRHLATSCRNLGGIGPDEVSAAFNRRANEGRIVAGDAQSCEFVIPGAGSVDVSVRPGMGRVTLNSWIRGQMPLAAAAVADVGDNAVWQPQLRELIAEKNDLLCDVTFSATDRNGPTDSILDHAGALCRLVFASARKTSAPVIQNNSMGK